ncbi:MAG: RNase H family protein [Campylobacterota bacterium]|nr:RNase H family protein [Campylobacterota bacterium]
MQIVTEKLLDLGVEKDCDINESQIILLDIKEGEKSQWRSLSLAKELSDARAELFVLLRDVKDKEIQEKIIANYKALQKFRKESLGSEVLTSPKCETQVSTPIGDVVIYCDGGCTPNPGQAGSGVAVYRAGSLTELWYGLYEPMGTNNTAELGALYQSLLIAEQEIDKDNKVEVKCDSMYSINCIKVWAISWEKKNWTKKGGEIKNLEIIKTSYYLYNKIKNKMILSHVKAHTGLEGNELADRMTMYAIEQKDEEFVQYDKKINIDEILSMRAG